MSIISRMLLTVISDIENVDFSVVLAVKSIVLVLCVTWYFIFILMNGICRGFFDI